MALTVDLNTVGGWLGGAGGERPPHAFGLPLYTSWR